MPDVMFTGPEGRLEGRYHQSKEEHAPIALILHPHPQYGGTMNHKVVFSLFHVFVNRGFSVLRFNSRGVGRSQGRFDSGMGELSDAAAALDWLQSMNADAKSCWIAGYSFGAWIGMQLLMRRPEIDCFISVAPPANSYDFAFLAPCPSSGLIVGAEKDEVVPLADIQKLVARLSLQKDITVESRTIKGANHFFHDSLDKLAVDVDKYVAKCLLNPPGRGDEQQGAVAQAYAVGEDRQPPAASAAAARRSSSGKADRQAAQRAHREEGESLRLQRIAVPAEAVGRHDLAARLRGDRFQQSRIARAAAGDRPIASTGAGKWRAASAMARAVPRVSVAAPSATLTAVGPRIAEVAAVERLGRLAREVAMLAEALEARAIDLARCGERAVACRSAGRRACAHQSSIGPLPGPVSKASSVSSAPIHVTLATPPIFTTASGRGRSRTRAA